MAHYSSVILYPILKFLTVKRLDPEHIIFGKRGLSTAAMPVIRVHDGRGVSWVDQTQRVAKLMSCDGEQTVTWNAATEDDLLDHWTGKLPETSRKRCHFWPHPSDDVTGGFWISWHATPGASSIWKWCGSVLLWFLVWATCFLRCATGFQMRLHSFGWRYPISSNM